MHNYTGIGRNNQQTVGLPSWQSDWLILRSQAGQNSFLELYHGLDELPLKGKALVRPLSGANSGFSFEAIGSAQADDDINVTYYGVVFVYNSTHSRLGAPTGIISSRFQSSDAGRIFCAGLSVLLFVYLGAYNYLPASNHHNDRRLRQHFIILATSSLFI